MSREGNWRAEAACSGHDPELFFSGAVDAKVAQGICKSCPVKLECLQEALDDEIMFGVWGGLSERERKALLRRRSSRRLGTLGVRGTE